MITHLSLQGLTRSELLAAVFGLSLIACGLIWMFVRWVASARLPPEPWDQDVANALEQEDSHPLCHRCLSPYDETVHFCPHCGIMVGPVTGWVPPLYYYALGDVFRSGSGGTYRPSVLMTVSFFIAAFLYLFYIPFPIGLVLLVVYCYLVVKNAPPWRNLELTTNPKEG